MNPIEAVKWIMEREGIKQNELSRKTGISQQVLSRSMSKGMSIGTLLRIVRCMGYEIVLQKCTDRVEIDL